MSGFTDWAIQMTQKFYAIKIIGENQELGVVPELYMSLKAALETAITKAELIITEMNSTADDGVFYEIHTFDNAIDIVENRQLLTVVRFEIHEFGVVDSANAQIWGN